MIIAIPIIQSTPNIQIHPLQNNIHVSKVQCGSAFEPVASALPYYCTSIYLRSWCTWHSRCVDPNPKKKECVSTTRTYHDKYTHVTWTAAVPSNQELPGFLITAPPSVLVPPVPGAIAVWIWECLLIVNLGKRSKTFKNTKDTQISCNSAPGA